MSFRAIWIAYAGETGKGRGERLLVSEREWRNRGRVLVCEKEWDDEEMKEDSEFTHVRVWRGSWVSWVDRNRMGLYFLFQHSCSV